MFENTKNVYVDIMTDKDFEDVKEAAKRRLLTLGGTLTETKRGFEIEQGTKGVNFSFAAEFDSIVEIREKKDGAYEIAVAIDYKPSGLTWLCVVLGWFFLYFLWLVPAVYFFIDPTQTYQQVLNRIERDLE